MVIEMLAKIISTIRRWLKNKDFQLIVLVDSAVVGLMGVFLTVVPASAINFNIILSSTTSLGAIIAANILAVKAVKMQQTADELKEKAITEKVTYLVDWLKGLDDFAATPEGKEFLTHLISLSRSLEKLVGGKNG